MAPFYIVGVWDSEEHVRSHWSSDEFENVLTSVGFPSPKNPNLTLPDLTCDRTAL